MSLVKAPSVGGAVSTVAPSRFGVFWAISTVRSHAASSMMPMPFSAGQMSLLTSFICHSWWLSPSCEPAATTMSRQASGLSRQYAQPWIDAASEADGDVAVGLVGLQPRRVGPDRVLQHADADLLVGDRR